jgi:antitoxin component YwqK of YwqJK toxin-antitoxin module
MSEGCYKDGKKNAQFFWYDNNGNILDEDVWENDRCVDMREGDE